MLIPSINTMGLPDWSFEQVIRFAGRLNVPFVELRGLSGQLDLLTLPEFSAPESVQRNRLLLADCGVRILSLNLSERLADFSPLQAERIVRYAQLADDYDVAYLRFFAGGAMASAADRTHLMDAAAAVVGVLAQFRVAPIVETHDTFTHAADVLQVAQSTSGALGVLWDVAHTQNIASEAWQDTYAALRPYIRYLHVKDGVRTASGELHYTDFLAGDLHIRELLTYLKSLPERVIISYEWEKLWHPELAHGQEAIPQFLSALQEI